MPVYDKESHAKKISHTTPKCEITWHIPRYANLRDMDTFRILEEDLASGTNEYDSKKITELYEEKIGSKSPIHLVFLLTEMLMCLLMQILLIPIVVWCIFWMTKAHFRFHIHFGNILEHSREISVCIRAQDFNRELRHHLKVVMMSTEYVQAAWF